MGLINRGQLADQDIKADRISRPIQSKDKPQSAIDVALQYLSFSDMLDKYLAPLWRCPQSLTVSRKDNHQK